MKKADTLIIIKKLMRKSSPDLTSDGDEEFIPAEELKEEEEKKAQAFDMGVRFALAERGIGDGPRQELAIKVAMAIAENENLCPQDTIAILEKAAVESVNQGFNVSDWITQETENLHPVAKFLLLTLGGAGLGAAGGATAGKTMELLGKKPGKSMTLLGALTGGGIGALKHVSDSAKDSTRSQL